MNQLEYERYLKRLEQLVYLELVVKVATFDYFTEYASRLDGDPIKVEPMLWPIVSGLRYDVTFSLHRLVVNGNCDRNIIHFLNVSSNEFKRISWKEDFPRSRIRDFVDEWNSKSDVIDRLTKRRNKFFAHYDKDHFYDPDTSLESIPLNNEDVKDLTRLLQRTVSFFCLHLFGSRPISMEGSVYASAERLYLEMRRNSHSQKGIE